MFKIFASLALVLLFVGNIWSAPILVTNSSFENLHLNPGDAGVVDAPKGPYTLLIEGWTISQLAGTYRPTAAPPTANYYANVSGGTHLATNVNGLVDGSQVAFLQSGGYMYQDLAAVLGAFSSFTVNVAVGKRVDFPADSAYSISLMTSSGSVLTTYAGTLQNIDGGFWAQRTVTFTGDTSAYAGQQLRLWFDAPGGQVNFDNVQVMSAVPEVGGPTVFWTMLGTVAFWICRKKRASRSA